MILWSDPIPFGSPFGGRWLLADPIFEALEDLSPQQPRSGHEARGQEQGEAVETTDAACGKGGWAKLRAADFLNTSRTTPTPEIREALRVALPNEMSDDRLERALRTPSSSAPGGSVIVPRGLD